MSILIDVFRNSILVTGLVMVMMLLIEYVHIYSRGRSFARLQNRPFRQIVLAALLGAIPGCIGGFAAVSLYAHGIISFGALIAMMISAIGDEAFILFATVPKVGLLLVPLLFLLALLIGWLTDKWAKKSPAPFVAETHYALHHQEGCLHGAHTAAWGSLRKNLSSINFKRAALLIGLLLFILAMGLGFLEHEPHHQALDPTEPATGHLSIFSERWFNLFFTVLAVLTLFLTVKASNHFISEHLWGHIIKKHLLTIFLWTFGALLCIELGMHYLHLDQWVMKNGYVVLLIAALIGLIPES
ncbi:MAG: putative manganese transporter, partial [Bacteroidales bacterium]|nr:putative manganese transporter [Bacteroidales bacterium]